MSIVVKVTEKLDAIKAPDDWRRAVALRLAAILDIEPNASMARELRMLMHEISGTATTTLPGDPVDQIKERREARIADAAR